MNNELVKRYIYAVVSNLPAKSQPDVEKEIESMIVEMLDVRCKDAEPNEDDVRQVLTELGAPEDLAVKYSGDEDKALISGIYLLWYKKLLRLVLPIVFACVALCVLISEFAKWQPQQGAVEFIPELVAEVATSAIGAAMQAFMWITLVLIIMERKKVKPTETDFISKLRPVPNKKAQIRLHRPVISALISVAIATLMLWFSFFIGIYTESTGWLPLLNESHVHAYWYLPVAWAVLSIVNNGVRFMERRYSRRVAITTGIANALSGVAATVFFASSSVINPAFIERIGALVDGADATKLHQLLSNTHYIILAIVLFALALDMAMTLYYKLRYYRHD